MSDDAELSISELRRKRAQSTASSSPPPHPAEERVVEPIIIETAPRSARGRMLPPGPPPPDYEDKVDLPFDPWRLPEALRLRWHWLVLAACVLGLLGGVAGYWRGKYTIPVTLTLRDLSARFIASQEGESYKPPQLSSQTLVNFLTSPELISYVSSHASPPISEKRLVSSLTIKQDRDSETINVTMQGKNPADLVALANLYAQAAVTVSKEAQMENPSNIYTHFTKELAQIKSNEDELEEKLTSLRTNAGVIDPELENPAFEKERVDLLVKIDMTKSELEMLDAKSQLIQNEPVQKRLQDAEDRLKALQERGLLDEHPAVKGVKAEITRLTEQLTTAAGGDASIDPLEASRRKSLKVELDELQRQSDELKMKVDKLYEHAGEYNKVKAELNLLEKVHRTLDDRLFEAQQYRDNAEGYYKIPPEAELKDVDTHGRFHRSMAYGIAGGVAGFLAAMMVILFTEVIDPRMKTATDVRRVTQLPVLATLGNLKKMDDDARKAWAFRTWTILSGTLSPSANSGTVCGIISCAHGEGRTTWVELLVGAARERGFEVTKLDFGRNARDFHPPGEHSPTAKPETGSAETAGEAAAPHVYSMPDKASSSLSVPESNQKLAQASYASVIHIQLPGLVWNLERRIQFQEELDKWRAISRAVILIDLPPASVPEAILLAENLPQVLWLVDSGKSHARETRLHLETLRHARCKLVGAVLNHEPEPLIKL